MAGDASKALQAGAWTRNWSRQGVRLTALAVLAAVTVLLTSSTPAVSTHTLVPALMPVTGAAPLAVVRLVTVRLPRI